MGGKVLKICNRSAPYYWVPEGKVVCKNYRNRFSVVNIALNIYIVKVLVLELIE